MHMSLSFGVSWFMLLLLSLLCIHASTSDMEKVIHVCGYNTSLSVPLHRLANSPELANFSNITIVLCNGNSLLDGKLTFSGKKSIQFVGGEASFLTCHGESVGIGYCNVHRVEVSNITFKNCGSMHWKNFSSSILIQNSSEIFLLHCSVLDSRGLGMAILQSYAVIDIIDCTFRNCSAKASACGGGGLFVELRSSKPAGQHMKMNIINTKFQYNNASLPDNRNCSNKNFLNGGGLTLRFYSTTRNQITIQDCIVESNTALLWGGGLNIVIANTSSGNTITVTNTTIDKNKCGKGGGGADVGVFSDFVNNFPENNTIFFIDTSFEGNLATFGGGAIIYSSVGDLYPFESNNIVFMNCYWINNVARYASALYLNLHNEKTYNSAGLLPKVMLKNCIFNGNHVRNKNFRYHNRLYVQKFPATALSRGKGCFFSIGYKVTFNSIIKFMNNSGSALYLASSIVNVTNGSELSFIGNSGHYGGAIGLFGTSILHLHDNVVLNFTNNTATVKGGAIYQGYTDTLGYISLIKCFFHYTNDQNFKESNITYIFQKNRIANGNSYSVSSLNGTSIYMHSLKSCEGLIDFSANKRIVVNDTTEFIGPVAHFIFLNSTGPAYEVISTGMRRFWITMDITGNFMFVPGKVTLLPIEVRDDFNRTIVSVYQAIIMESDHSVSLHPDYTHIYNNTVLLYGTPGSKGNLSFSLSSIGDTEIILPLVLVNCPPGYVLNGEKESASCVCSTDDANKKAFFKGISYCNQSKFQAVLKRGYWMGYKNLSPDHERQHVIVSLSCPRSFCNRKELYLLPNTSSVLELDRAICGMERTDILCGKCRENYSAFYHSEDLRCGHTKHCKLGWLIYLVSEIFPVTLFFMVVIIWDIQFTTGFIQGFIFYSQIFDTLLLSANGQISGSNSLIVLKSFLNIFNLNFFIYDQLSFCLWENASSLDMLAFKYITIVYAIFLVFLSVLVLSFCKLTTVDKILNRIRGMKQNFSSSMIHGLSGFLVICYSQCTKISFLILTPATIISAETGASRRIVYFDGGLQFLRGRHLIYAIPALMFVITIVAIPPIILLVYPLCYKVLSFLGLAESKLTRILCKIMPLEKLKPFFDSFQSSFKDKCRYFSGLYFVYRFSTLLSFATIQDLSLYYLAVEIQFVLMLATHAWMQPYKIPWHNKLDTFIFSILIVVNFVTLFRYSCYDTTMLKVFQICLSYLPLFYMVFYTMGCISKKIMNSCGYKGTREKIEDRNLTLSLATIDRDDEDALDYRRVNNY